MSYNSLWKGFGAVVPSASGMTQSIPPVVSPVILLVEADADRVCGASSPRMPVLPLMASRSTTVCTLPTLLPSESLSSLYTDPACDSLASENPLVDKGVPVVLSSVKAVRYSMTISP